MKKTVPLFLIFSLILSLSCSGKINFIIENNILNIKTSGNSLKLNLDENWDKISKNLKVINSHSIPDGEFYMIEPFPAEYGIQQGSDKVNYIVIYFNTENLSKYKIKNYKNMIIDYKKYNITFNNDMNIYQIKDIFDKNNILYDEINKNLLETKDDLIKIFYNNSSGKIHDMQVYFNKIKKTDMFDPVTGKKL